MGLLSHKVKISELEAGDHIYTYRTAFSYSHHGIYMGDNLVIHFTNDKYGNKNGISRKTCSDPNCGYRADTRRSSVFRSCLDCFLENGSLYRYQYGISTLEFAVKIRGGTCTTAECDPPGVVKERAKHLLVTNCEDFALYCKTGRRVEGGKSGSGQLSGAKAASAALLASGRKDAVEMSIEDVANSSHHHAYASQDEDEVDK